MKLPSKILLVILFFILTVGSSYAQQPVSSGIATYVTIKEKVVTGDIVSASSDGYQKTKISYDPTMFGVVTDNPAISFEDTTSPNAKPVISRGKVYVRVTTKNGSIKQGDLVTSSDIPGVGQKATLEGYVLGTASQEYTNKDPKAVGTILITLNITYNQGPTVSRSNLLQSVSQVIKAPYANPLTALRYAIAGILVIISFIIGISFFGKVSSLGVEAIGRNPLASKAILFGVVLHILLAGMIILAGVVLAYFILVL